MTRLIDADALWVKMKHRREYIGRPSDPVCLVEDTPTIPAIPVEWLEEHDGEDIRDRYGNIYGRRRITVLEALSIWQKEQEVR